MRIAAPLAVATLLAALFPAVASAATPIAATGGSDLIPALVIAGAGALVIVLIMVIVPSTRRGAGSTASAPGSPAVTAFRAHPADSPSTDGRTDAASSEHDDAAPVAADPPVTVATDPKRPSIPEPPSVPEPLPSSEHTASPEPVSASSVPVDEPAPVEERSPVAVADPPHAATVTPSASSAPPPSSTPPAPDLLAAFSPVAVLGESLDSEQVPVPVAQETNAALGPEIGATALLRDHSLTVPIAALILLGVTVQLVRLRRGR